MGTRATRRASALPVNRKLSGLLGEPTIPLDLAPVALVDGLVMTRANA